MIQIIKKTHVVRLEEAEARAIYNGLLLLPISDNGEMDDYDQLGPVEKETLREFLKLLRDELEPNE